MNGYNKTIIIGRLGNDPILKDGKKTQSTSFMLCNSTFKDGVEDVQWHKIVAYGKQAKLCADYLHNGDLCCIEGNLNRRSYKKDGETKYSVTIVAERITFLTSKRKHTEESETASE